MKRAEFLIRFPRASEATIRANCSDAIVRTGPAPTPPAPKAIRSCPGRVPRTRNLGTFTEAQYWQAVRSALRRAFRYWKPALAALKAAQVPFHGTRGQRWAYLCADCKKLFLRRQVQIDHVVAAGKLTDYTHIGDFLRRLTPERPEDFACRCLKCHQVKTNKEKKTPASG